MNEVNYNLPEWTVLSSKCHQGDILFNRTVLIHPLTFTVMEAIPFEMIEESSFTGPSLGIEYTDEAGQSQRILFVIHFTMSHNFETIFEKVADWYGEYLEWKDENKNLQIIMKQN